jgi:predicted lipoprotein with Yx(FWY)xxD motif
MGHAWGRSFIATNLAAAVRAYRRSADHRSMEVLVSLRLIRTLLAATALAGGAAVWMLAVVEPAPGRASTHKAATNSFTLMVSKGVHDTNAKFAQFAVKKVDLRENIAVGPNGFAVYTFQGETPRRIICKKSRNPASNCWAFWPPVSLDSAKGLSKQTGIKGKLGTFQNQGTLQLTLNGQPLYYFTPDIQSHNKRVATSDETKTFGSIWHIVKAAAPVTSTSTMPMPTTSPTSTNPYPGG